jgi:hypothetical protein
VTASRVEFALVKARLGPEARIAVNSARDALQRVTIDGRGGGSGPVVHRGASPFLAVTTTVWSWPGTARCGAGVTRPTRV